MRLSAFILPAVAIVTQVDATVLPRNQIYARDSPTGQCGTEFGSCSGSEVNRCCSQYGWCGDSIDHCGEGCQPAYGSCNGGGPGSPPPSGQVPFGSIIEHCTVPGTIALTFDDGPYIYTNRLLDILSEYGVVATFFITGNNLGKGAIDDPNLPWAGIIRRAYNNGHQIASHTWDHLDLDAISESDRRYQMTRLETALRNIIGLVPTYMRPPYIRCGGPCQDTLRDLGYHVIFWDLDTDDYNNDSPELIGNSKNLFSQAVSGASTSRSFLTIAHDIHEQTVEVLARYMIETGKANGFRFVSLGECMGDGNIYR